MAAVAVAPELAGTTLADPIQDGGYEFEYGFRGSVREMADASTVEDLVENDAKREFVLKWEYLTSAEKTDLETAFSAIKTTSGTFKSPDNVTYTVKRHPSQSKLKFVLSTSESGSVLRWSVTLKLREV